MQETFGQRFQRLRKKIGLTQEEIAEKVNLSAQAVSKWENVLTAPDIFVLPKLADILSVTLDELLGHEVLTTKVLPLEKRKDINSMLLKINVDSSDGDKVRINLPLSIIMICLESGAALPSINGKDVLSNIDFKQIIALIEQGVVGKLVEIESSDGDTVYISVE